MKHVFLVFIGGGFGSVTRYIMGKVMNGAENTIPLGTMLANVLGSLLIGLILGYLAKSTNVTESQSLLLATGFCGGFTTFSTFSFENQVFLKNGDYIQFLTYTFGTILLSISAVIFGLYVSKLV